MLHHGSYRQRGTSPGRAARARRQASGPARRSRRAARRAWAGGPRTAGDRGPRCVRSLTAAVPGRHGPESGQVRGRPLVVGTQHWSARALGSPPLTRPAPGARSAARGGTAPPRRIRTRSPRGCPATARPPARRPSRRRSAPARRASSRTRRPAAPPSARTRSAPARRCRPPRPRPGPRSWPRSRRGRCRPRRPGTGRWRARRPSRGGRPCPGAAAAAPAAPRSRAPAAALRGRRRWRCHSKARSAPPARPMWPGRRCRLPFSVFPNGPWFHARPPPPLRGPRRARRQAAPALPSAFWACAAAV